MTDALLMLERLRLAAIATRRAQKNFNLSRSATDLRIARDNERRLDAEIERHPLADAGTTVTFPPSPLGTTEGAPVAGADGAASQSARKFTMVNKVRAN